MLGFSAANLRYATEEAARCAVVKVTVCSDPDKTQVHASANFDAITNAEAMFVAAMVETCGKKVAGCLDFEMEMGVGRFTVPLSSTACLPQ